MPFSFTMSVARCRQIGKTLGISWSYLNKWPRENWDWTPKKQHHSHESCVHFFQHNARMYAAVTLFRVRLCPAILAPGDSLCTNAGLRDAKIAKRHDMVPSQHLQNLQDLKKPLSLLVISHRGQETICKLNFRVASTVHRTPIRT